MAYVKIEPQNSYDKVFVKELEQIENKINSSLPETLESAFYIPQDS